MFLIPAFIAMQFYVFLTHFLAFCCFEIDEVD